MAAPELITGWRALANAVNDHAWTDAERLALQLAERLEHLLTADKGKPQGDRDGLYSIGWQKFQDAPHEARRAIERFNLALRRWPIPRR